MSLGSNKNADQAQFLVSYSAFFFGADDGTLNRDIHCVSILTSLPKANVATIARFACEWVLRPKVPTKQNSRAARALPFYLVRTTGHLNRDIHYVSILTSLPRQTSPQSLALLASGFCARKSPQSKTAEPQGLCHFTWCGRRDIEQGYPLRVYPNEFAGSKRRHNRSLCLRVGSAPKSPHKAKQQSHKGSAILLGADDGT